MDLRGASLILSLLLLAYPTLQQTPASAKKRNARKGKGYFLDISEVHMSLWSLQCMKYGALIKSQVTAKIPYR